MKTKTPQIKSRTQRKYFSANSLNNYILIKITSRPKIHHGSQPSNFTETGASSNIEKIPLAQYILVHHTQFGAQ